MTAPHRSTRLPPKYSQLTAITRTIDTIGKFLGLQNISTSSIPPELNESKIAMTSPLLAYVLRVALPTLLYQDVSDSSSIGLIRIEVSDFKSYRCAHSFPGATRSLDHSRTSPPLSAPMVLESRISWDAISFSTLTSHNILVKAKNFLVFQGEVEVVVSRSPRELSQEYEKAKEAQECATENATFNFMKRRGIVGETKRYKESEAERFESLCDQKDNPILKRILYKPFHIEQALEAHARDIQTKSKTLAEQARARTAVAPEERKVKEAEKALEAKEPELVDVDAKIKHIQKTAKFAEDTGAAKLHSLGRELSNAGRAAGKPYDASYSFVSYSLCAKAYRLASRHNTSLSENSLAEYRSLKASASVLTISERQALETLSRDERTASWTLTQAQVRTKDEELQRNQERLRADEQTQKSQQLEEKLATLQGDRARSTPEYENQQNRDARKLANVFRRLLQAGVDRHEFEREARLKETLASLQHIFPGVRGRVVDLCKPVQRKYETAVSVILGRNINAVVVDEKNCYRMHRRAFLCLPPLPF
ncbi:hypothetical protein F4604DRAFT_1992222 [Suillus subluteus]|nr:hypothetical protein F4604DRAFT_1992222 [Suillus subluteus]